MNDLNKTLEQLLWALKDYNRALIDVTKEADALVTQLIDHLEAGSAGQHDCKNDEYGTGHCSHPSHQFELIDQTVEETNIAAR